MTTTEASPVREARISMPSRLTAAAAGAYVAAWLIGLVLAPAAPPPDAPTADIVRHYLDSSTAVLASSTLVHGVAGVALGLFATSLAKTVRAAGGLRRAVIGTGVAASALSLSQVAIAAAAVTIAESDETATTGLFHTLNLVDVIKIALLASFVLIATTATARVRPVPRRLRLLAAALTPTLVVGSAALIAPTPLLSAALAASLIGLLVWTGYVAVVALRSASAPGA